MGDETILVADKTLLFLLRLLDGSVAVFESPYLYQRSAQ